MIRAENYLNTTNISINEYELGAILNELNCAILQVISWKWSVRSYQSLLMTFQLSMPVIQQVKWTFLSYSHPVGLLGNSFKWETLYLGKSTLKLVSSIKETSTSRPIVRDEWKRNIILISWFMVHYWIAAAERIIFHSRSWAEGSVHINGAGALLWFVIVMMMMTMRMTQGSNVLWSSPKHTFDLLFNTNNNIAILLSYDFYMHLPQSKVFKHWMNRSSN